MHLRRLGDDFMVEGEVIKPPMHEVG
jgi:hypothetical protein